MASLVRSKVGTVLFIPIIIPASSVSNPVLVPATIIASVALPDILNLFDTPTSIADVAPSSFILPPPKDIEASVEEISIFEADISKRDVERLTFVPSNFTKLPVASPT